MSIRLWHDTTSSFFTASLCNDHMKDSIATEVLLVQLPDKLWCEVKIQVGCPFEDPDNPGEWLCTVSLKPLHLDLRPARSNSAFHSLCLANSLVLELLHAVVEKGGTVWLAPNCPFPFEAYAFGVSAGGKNTAGLDIIQC